MDFQLNDEQREWQKTVREFVEAEVKSRAKETDEKAKFNWDAVKKMGPLGDRKSVV